MTVLALLLLVPAELPTVESKDFSQAVQENAIAATVRIVNSTKTIEGSGVVLKATGPFVYILTAGHVANSGDTLEIASFSAKSHPKPDKVYRSGEVLIRSLTPDLAVIRLGTADMLPAAAHLCPLDQAPEGDSLAGLTCGCNEGAAPTCAIDKLLGRRRVKKPGEREGTVCWQAVTPPLKGRSGGPLFDRRGRLIGLASGSGDGKGYYTHMEEIHAFLKQNGLKWLCDHAMK